MQHRRLPLNISDFERIRKRGCYYVDKTDLLYKMIDSGTYFFLSRPRRFGKSLLVSTLQHLFEGHESLFRGLAIHKNWDWNQTYPVIKLSFNQNYNTSERIEKDLLSQLNRIKKTIAFDLSPSSSFTANDLLGDILHHVYHKTGQHVVVLIDEYDKPILDVITDTESAIHYQDSLRGFYGVLKGNEDYLQFVFLTGISMFSKVNLSSSMNNLEDISLDPEYSSICGYIDQDLDKVFAPELEELDREKIRYWYNGYSWLGTSVYNPYAILMLLKRRKFQGWWHKTSIPKYLYDIIKERQVTPIEIATHFVDDEVVSSFDVDSMKIDSLLFQSGYLTIVDEKIENHTTKYKLSHPNFEVRHLLSKALFDHISGLKVDMYASGEKLINALIQHEFEEFKKRLHSLLAKAPHPWYDSSSFQRHEAWYASVLYWSMLAYGTKVTVEGVSHRGRCDMVVCYKDHVFVMEFKMANSKNSHEALEEALAQIKEKGYADAYRDQGEHIYLMALVFDQKERNIVEVATEYL